MNNEQFKELITVLQAIRFGIYMINGMLIGLFLVAL